MNLAIAKSVLKHPFRRCVAIFAPDGTLLACSPAARALIPALHDAVLPEALVGWCELLKQHPDRVVNDVLDIESRQFHGEMHAATDNDGQLLAFTFSALAAGVENIESGQAEPLQRAFELSDAGICDWNMPHGSIAYSRNWLNIVGYAPGELTDSSDEWLSRLHPDDVDRVKSTLAHCLSGASKLFECEHRLRTRNGQWRWVADRGHIISWQASGKPKRMLISTQDITAYKELEARLRENEALLQKAQSVGKIGSWAYDPVADVSWWSEQMYRIYGLSPDASQSDRASHLKLYTPASSEKLHAALDKSLKTGAPYDLELEFVRTDGAHRWVAARAEVLHDEDGRLRLIGVVQDITEQRESEAQRHWNSKMMAQISSMGKIGGFEWTIDGDEVQWTEQVYHIAGVPIGTAMTKEMVGAMYELTSRERLEDVIQEMIATGMPVTDLELALFTRDGRRVWVRCAAELAYENDIPHRIVGLVQDITEEHEAGERIEQLAHYDSLTGLPNRFLFHQRARDAVNDARRSKAMLALLFIDLDRFKNVNDSMGHAIGDQLLFEVGGRLRACVRSHDVIGRLSGDEFLILLRDIRRPDDAAIVARKILTSLQEPITLAGVDLHIGASIGIALWNESSKDLDDLMRAADTAMYAAKDLGRNTFQFYTDAFLERVQRRLTVENELRAALRRNEFRLVYQPTVNVKTGTAVGIEALLRWTTASGESRPPDEFIAVAEDSGEIIPIGDWVLSEACRQAAAWAAKGLPFERIAVNVSAVQLRDPDFGERVLRICAATGWAPQRLELELTESALMRDTETLRQTFTLFEQSGIRLAVDDFGTGFSNLHYLTRFPVQHLKIDRSFVQTMLSDSTTRELTQVIIGLGHALNMSVVAEGVETAEQMQALQQQGCDEFQGYLFSKPLPADAMCQWLQKPHVMLQAPV